MLAPTELSDLLTTLRTHGVTSFTSGDLSISLGPLPSAPRVAPAPEETDAAPTAEEEPSPPDLMFALEGLMHRARLERKDKEPA